MKLYEIAEELKPIVEQLENMDVDDEVIRDTLESLDLMDNLQQKLESIYRVYRNMEAEIKMLDDEIKRLKAQRDAKKRRLEGLKQYVDQSLRSAGLQDQKFKLSIGSIGYRKDPASVEILDPEKLPEDFVKYEPKIDKTGLLNMVKSNYNSKLPEQVIAFDDLGFRIVNNKKSLRFS